jgi:hypothetical protein
MKKEVEMKRLLKNVDAADEVILALIEILDNAVVNGRYRVRAVKAIEAATDQRHQGEPTRVYPWDHPESNAANEPCSEAE